MLALTALMLCLGAQSLDCFLKSDDFKWVRRTVADAPRP